MFSLNEYDYPLPSELIAQEPVKQRDQSRLLLMNRDSGRLSHHRFNDICDYIRPTDVLVVNNTEVLPARLFGKKETGGKVDVLILDYARHNHTKTDPHTMISDCLVNASKRPRPGSRLIFSNSLTGEVVEYNNGIYTIKFIYDGDFTKLLYQTGHMPLPPYIKRRPGDDPSYDDRVSYQTVYASKKGAIAAPTAGLHFTQTLLEKIKAKGVKIVAITLHVGYGTFLPVKVADIRDHKIHAEAYSISKLSADEINRLKFDGGRIIAVGTTCVRTLEYASNPDGKISFGNGICDLYIYPGYRFKIVDAMITNFHLPKSTLLMLVSAFAGKNTVLHAYEEAIKKKYRFYSYGDAMFIV